MPPQRTRRWRLPGLLVLLMLAMGGGFATFWLGLLPARYTPLPPLDLDEPWPLLIDWQIAELRADSELCQRVMRPPHIEARAIADRPIKEGCGWRNAVRVSTVGGVRLPVDTLTCQMSAALALWLTHDVQPLAQSMLGARVASIQHLGGYACRNIIGSPMLKDWRSQHATANAIDIAGFTLADGRRITVARHWKGNEPEAAFLREAHQRACRYFRVALSPEFNQQHHDHFHFDRSALWRCR